MRPIEIKEDIYWVGAVDYESFDFHGYTLSPHGTTYNAYLVQDEKTVLFDTVKAEYASVLLNRLSHLAEPSKVDYIVINHVELDHAGALPELVRVCKPEKIFCSPMGLKAMEAHFDITGWPIEVKKSGDTLCIGKRTVHFLETRMIHWPDSMFSYIAEDKILISNDAFGQNIASSERFADEIPKPYLDRAIQEYYHNIVLPYSPQVLKILDQVAAMELDIEMICPDHGLIFRTKEESAYALETYREFALQKMKKRALIIYDTMWNSTERMAYAIGEGLQAVGVPYRIMNLKLIHHSEIMTEMAKCGLVIMGSPTHNNGILPSVAGMLTYMKGLRPQNRIGCAFGSFGWSGEGINIISDWFDQMGFEQPVEALKHKYVPTNDTVEKCFEMGKALGEALIAKMDKYICNLCGYVYEPAIGDEASGVKSGTPFDKVPTDWVCPVCGAGKGEFGIL